MRVIPRDEIDADVVKAADQVLVGLNKTRRAYNKRLRELRGFKGDLPQVGEKLVCLRTTTSQGPAQRRDFPRRTRRGRCRGAIA